MKAKLPESEQTLVSGARYLCVWCDAEFSIKKGELRCPSCGNNQVRDIIPIYLENDPQEEALYCEVDFHGG